MVWQVLYLYILMVMLQLFGDFLVQRKKMKVVFFFIKSVRTNGDLIDSVLGNFWWRTKLFLVLSMGCEMRQLQILLILGESISHLGFYFLFFIFFYNFLE